MKNKNSEKKKGRNKEMIWLHTEMKNVEYRTLFNCLEKTSRGRPLQNGSNPLTN
jgi:hypothetical protein